MMNAKVDIPVLIIFFNRPEMLKRVFEKVREAKPTALFLYQDGARVGRQDDEENVQRCREVVSQIDWDCEVHTLYQEKNYGCDPSEYIAIRWFFDNVEKGIILEDDDVPAVSFFEYCKKLLDKYEGDTRIATISGMNHLGTYRSKKSDADYFFANASSISGWATWKRFVDLWDTEYSFLDSREMLQTMKQTFVESKVMKSDRVRFDLYLDRCREHKATGVEHYETLVSSTRLLNGQMGIFPCENMISNIGNDGESTHGAANIKLLPRATQRVFNIPRREMNFPIKHPEKVEADNKYALKREGLLTASIWNYPFRWLESKIRCKLYGNKV